MQPDLFFFIHTLHNSFNLSFDHITSSDDKEFAIRLTHKEDDKLYQYDITPEERVYFYNI